MERAGKSSIFPSFIIVSALVGGVGLPDTSVAETEQQRGLAAYQKGDYDMAFKLISVSAENGNVKSQLLISSMYRRGVGVEQDEYEAFKWCKKSAEEEMLEAQFQLGLMYLNGEGVTENYDEALKWIWAAADRGYPQATEVLTFMLSDEFTTEHELGC